LLQNENAFLRWGSTQILGNRRGGARGHGRADARPVPRSHIGERDDWRGQRHRRGGQHRPGQAAPGGSHRRRDPQSGTGNLRYAGVPQRGHRPRHKVLGQVVGPSQEEAGRACAWHTATGQPEAGDRQEGREVSEALGRDAYFSQIVRRGATARPTVSSAATGPAGMKPAGTRAFTCSNPTAPGALPAYRIWAGNPATVRVTGSKGLGYGTAPAWPETLGPLVSPSPVAEKVTIEPSAVGAISELGEPSGFTTTGKTAGAVSTTARSSEPDGL